MLHQENDNPLPKISLKLFTQSKPIPTETKIIKNKESYPAISVTCQRYYKSKISKRKGTQIPLSVMDEDAQDLEPNKTSNKITVDTILEAEKENQKHNWNDDPLGLCLTEEQQESKVEGKGEEKKIGAKVKIEEANDEEKEPETKSKVEEVNNKEKDTEIETETEAGIEENEENQPGNLESKTNNNIESEITMIYTNGVISERDGKSFAEEQPIFEYLTESLEDLSEIDDAISPINSPSLESTELNNSTMLENQESLSHHLYAHYQDYYDTESREVKEGGKEEYEKREEREGELVLEDFSSGSLRSFNEIGIDSYDVTWDAIFHPMSTFQHIQGELEYHNWNSEDEPVTADIVAERLIQVRLYPLDSNNSPHYPSFSEPVQSEAVIPIITPTPILKSSPVLTIESDDSTTTVSNADEINTLANKNSDSMIQEVFFDQDKQKHYFNILQNIRGPSHGTIISFQLTVNTAKKCIKSNSKKAKSSSKKKQEEGRGVLPAIFGKRCIRETEKLDHVALDDEEDDEEDDIEKNIEVIIAEKQRYWNERRLFWYGFLCPLLWFYGSIHIKSSRRFRSSVNKRWQKRCRLAFLYFSVVTSVVALVVVVKMAGNAAIRQTQSDEIRAVIAV